MILLAVNFVSEAMKPEPAPVVRDWLDAQTAETLHLSSVTVAELLFGVGAPRRGGAKINSRARSTGCLFCSRAESFTLMRRPPVVTRISPSRPGMQAGGFRRWTALAAIAAAHGFVVATRDASAFAAAGVPTIDPWTAAD